MWATVGLVLAACPRKTVDLQTISITPENATFGRGEAAQFVATGFYADGTTKVITDTVSWSVDDAYVAKSDGSMPGLVLGLQDGSTVVRAKLKEVEATRSFTVSGAGVTRLEVEPATPVVPAGLSLQLKATAILSDGMTVDVTKTATWSAMTDSTALTMPNSDGRVVGVTPGEGTVIVSYHSLTVRVGVKVSDAVINGISISPANPTLPAGVSQAMVATAQLSDNSTLDVTTQARWTSSAPLLAFVSNAAADIGTVLARAPGHVSLSAKVNGTTGVTAITVTDATISRLEVSPPSASLPKSVSQMLAATAVFSDGTRTDVTSQATWSSSDSSIVTVSPVGKIVAIAVGSASVTATLGTAHDASVITVTPATMDRIDVTPARPSLAAGTTVSLMAVGHFVDGTSQDVTSQVVWTSADSAIATVSNTAPANGTLRGVSAGGISVTAAMAGNTTSITVTVTPAVLTGLQVTAPQSLPLGATTELSATGLFSDGTSMNVTQQASWTSSDSTIAAVSSVSPSRGHVSTTHTGTVTVVVSFGTMTSSTTVEVTNAVLQSISLAPQPVSMPIGSPQQMVATGIYSDATTQDLTAQGTWSSSMSSIADVSNAMGSAGLITPIAVGSATITVRSGSVSASIVATVTPAALVSMSISPNTIAIPAGRSQTFVATGAYTDGTVRVITEQSSWSSSDVTVASMSETPVVASAVGGIPEIVVPGETGLLVPFEAIGDGSPEPVDPDAFARDLASAINTLLGDDALRTRMGRASRERVLGHFSWRSIAQETLAFYRDLLAT